MIRRVVPSALRRAAVFPLLLLAAASAGCAGSGEQVREKSALEWYDEGRALAGRKKYDEAVAAFQEAAKGYRGADLDAEIRFALADAYFAKEEYPAAVEAFNEFLRLHPHNSRSDLAQLRIGLGWMKQMRSADRSQEPARRAAAAFEALLRGYPRSPLAAEARENLTVCRRRLAEHEMHVGNYYLRVGSYAAAASRFETVLREYADLGFTDEALFRLGSCYRALDRPEKAAEVFERLRRDHPGSRFVKDLDSRKG